MNETRWADSQGGVLQSAAIGAEAGLAYGSAPPLKRKCLLVEMAYVSKEHFAGRDDAPSKAMSIINDKEQAVMPIGLIEAISFDTWVRVASKPPSKKTEQRPTFLDPGLYTHRPALPRPEDVVMPKIYQDLISFI
jgi:hypothetical protein